MESDVCGMQHMGAHERVVVCEEREPGTSVASFPDLGEGRFIPSFFMGLLISERIP